MAAIVHGGLAVDWNADAARDLAAAIEARDDVRVDEIQEVTAETAKASSPNRGQVREMLTAIATWGVGGALGTGITAGLGHLLSQLPL